LRLDAREGCSIGKDNKRCRNRDPDIDLIVISNDRLNGRLNGVSQDNLLTICEKAWKNGL
jgi:hypothetical protein